MFWRTKANLQRHVCSVLLTFYGTIRELSWAFRVNLGQSIGQVVKQGVSTAVGKIAGSSQEGIGER